MPRFLFVLGALALAASTMTALRFPGLPFGVPEIIGGLFLAASLGVGKPLLPNILNYIALAGAVLVGWAIGSANNMFLGDISITNPLEYASTLYAILIAAFLSNEVCYKPHRIIWIARALGVVNLLHLIPIIAYFLSIDIGISGWLGDDDTEGAKTTAERLEQESEADGLRANRYMGFSTNPNQLVVAASIGTVFFPWIAHRIRDAIAPVWYLLTLVSLSLLIFSQGSTGMMAVAAVAFFALMRKYTAVEDDTGRSRYSITAMAIMWTILLPALFVVKTFADRAISRGSGDASGRFPLWRNGWEATVQSNFLGLGPGPHSGHFAPFEEEEAHNVALDLLNQGGVISLVAFAFLLWIVFRQSISGRTKIGIGLFVVFLVLSTTHYLLRHPLMWMAVFLPVAINHYYSRPAELWREQVREQRRLAESKEAAASHSVNDASLRPQ